MLINLVAWLGPWSWWILGMALLAAEMAAPGVFLIWIGLAAMVVGAASLALWGEVWWSWQLQLVLFAVLSLAITFVGRSYFARRHGESDQPLLNRRGDSLVGRTATLVEPIREGRGRIRLDDTWWSVTGPDLPAGMRVRVADWTGSELIVEPVA
ncbi:membrane protein implicated in regulation of membrane protease activity [Neorhizobium galegae]|uniref:NfeD family protein n=1 Tax=Neorhizobium galegae TaxID=399 RepID=UPI001AEAE16F|nr:NfeD family protein [Neorhizobium galegae]MBP2550062.1 membrane protein implicated in regulation of membrane protease activity [Neorhizobium galegae]